MRDAYLGRVAQLYRLVMLGIRPEAELGAELKRAKLTAKELGAVKRMARGGLDRASDISAKL
jgi:hypothetical protein